MSENIVSRNEIYDQISENLDIDVGDVKRICNEFFKLVEGELAEGSSVKIVNFGNFYTTVTKPRTMKNHLGHGGKKKIKVPAKTQPKWKASKSLRERLNE